MNPASPRVISRDMDGEVEKGKSRERIVTASPPCFLFPFPWTAGFRRGDDVTPIGFCAGPCSVGVYMSIRVGLAGRPEARREFGSAYIQHGTLLSSMSVWPSHQTVWAQETARQARLARFDFIFSIFLYKYLCYT